MTSAPPSLSRSRPTGAWWDEADARAPRALCCRPWLVGEDPLQPTQVRQAIYARLGDLDLAEAGSALSGIYAALWEIKDKQILLSTTPAAWAGRIAREARSFPAHPFEAPANAIHASAPWPQDSAA